MVKNLVVFLCLIICGSANAATTNEVVFDNALVKPWKLNNNGWSNKATIASNPVLQTVMAAWGDLSLDSLDASNNWINISPTDYAYLDFDINPNSLATAIKKDLYISLQNQPGMLPLSQFVGTMANNSWTHVHIPLSVLNPKGIIFQKIDFLNNSGDAYTFLLDRKSVV